MTEGIMRRMRSDCDEGDCYGQRAGLFLVRHPFIVIANGCSSSSAMGEPSSYGRERERDFD
ncbi:hypothetical protein L484_016071 [Morus notabilis]|uniref:Uncharacterized protein n=1 Tax=Morus notabilis TaxID=981085 RepID=W9SD70_9ROSA|nr:hypothetical protein L484_016071 [Morus notabilis]